MLIADCDRDGGSHEIELVQSLSSVPDLLLSMDNTFHPKYISNGRVFVMILHSTVKKILAHRGISTPSDVSTIVRCYRWNTIVQELVKVSTDCLVETLTMSLVPCELIWQVDPNSP